uniref:Uncharacterized protein n=1 Tax=Callorhinchus milii TaxID=7868 RepID=A0A4W3GFG1_CALMI
MWDSLSPRRDSPGRPFYPGESCRDEKEYSDFDYAGPPRLAVSNLVKQPAKSILKCKGPEPLGGSEYKPGSGSYSRLKSGFPGKPVKSILKKSEGFGSRGYTGEEQGAEQEELPSPGQFFRSESNNILVQTSFPEQAQAGADSQTHPSGSFPRPHGDKLAPALSSPVSATSTIEFKNMLKIASRRSTDEKPLERPLSPVSGTEGASEKGGRPGFETDEEEEERGVSELTRDGLEEKGAPIETLGTRMPAAGRLMFGEPIQTLDSSRGAGRGSRSQGHGKGGSRSGWYERRESLSDYDEETPGMDAPELPQGMPPGFHSQYEDHLRQFQDHPGGGGGFRSNSYGPPFDRSAPKLGPPPGSLRDHLGPRPPGPPPPDRLLASCPPQDHVGPPAISL